MKDVALSRRLAAEALGTAFLLAAIVGSGIMAERLADGITALTLLCVALPTGAVLVVIIAMFANISGAHFNPAVTIAFLVRRRIALAPALAYMLVQAAGAVAGTWAAHLMFEEPLLQFSAAARTGPAQWFSESVAAFGLVLTIFGTLGWRAQAMPATVGLYIAAAHWFTASTSFANPAVTLARALTDTFTGIDPAHMPAFVAAQVLGALLAAWLSAWLFVEASAPQVESAGTARAAAE